MIKDIFTSLWRGKSLLRTLMNLALKDHNLRGQVIDIGGGTNPSYLSYFNIGLLQKRINVDFVADQQGKVLDLETERLPFTESSFDQALLFNVLEHIYNHQFVVGETYRVLKSGGELIGFVPFLINYHPDPHDFFRYTNEALERILHQAQFTDIKIKAIGRGPASVNFNNLMFVCPRWLRPLLWLIPYSLDWLLLKLRPNLTGRFPLGYLFTARK